MTTPDTNRPSDFQISSGPPPLVREPSSPTPAPPELTPIPAAQIAVPVEPDLTEAEAFRAKLSQARRDLDVKVVDFSRDILQKILPDNSALNSKIKVSNKTTHLERRGANFAVPTPHGFYYFKATVEDSNPHVMAFRIAPPVLTTGLFILNKDSIFVVTPDDLKRNIVRRSRAITLRRYLVNYESLLNGTGIIDPPGTKLSALLEGSASPTGTASAVHSPSLNAADSSQSSDQPRATGSSEPSEDEELEMVDLALREQIRTLYGVEDTEEGEWEISDTA